MENYITVNRIEKELDFVNLVITTTNIDAKNEDDYNETFKSSESVIFAHKKNFKNVEIADLISDSLIPIL